MIQASQLIASQYRNAEINKNVWGDLIYNVKNYGVKGDGVHDDTYAIQKVIDNTKRGRIVFPQGDYVLSRSGKRNLSFSGLDRWYSLIVLEKQNITFEFEPGCRFLMDMGETQFSCGFWVEESEEISFIGPHFKGHGVKTSLHLEEGVGISIDRSKKVNVISSDFENMRGGARAYNSSNIYISRGFSRITRHDYASGHFALYQCQESEIENCTTYGATLDGDIFIYGGGSVNCTLSNCKSYAYEYGDTTRTIHNLIGHGILIDSGGRNCKIVNCYVYGHYYGLDIKNGTEGGVIQGSTAEKCKVGIATRKGEGFSPVNAVSIIGNTVIPNGGNGNNDPLMGSLAGPFGIYITDAYGGTICDGNMIYNSIDTTANLDFYGIVVGISDNLFDADMGAFIISNNSISLENKNGTQYGSSRKTGILVTTQYRMVNVSIVGNIFDLPQSGMVDNFIVAEKVFGLTISNNTFGVLYTEGKPLIRLNGCVRATINNNNFGVHFGILQVYDGVGITFNGNMSADSLAGVNVPALLFSNATNIAINSNVSMIESGQNKDGEYFSLVNGSNWLVSQGNMLKLANKDSTNWYSSSATNFAINNNVID
ncbi:glycosyl hydrolase family 28-related protein [Paenibacillus lactis]|uniref:glycosyl hydrolase family 28-related protein n=1 Tax=Paenibacillus lactis TaxID=228574 RepID=UPI0036B6C079